jgi:hypothetical protein
MACATLSGGYSEATARAETVAARLVLESPDAVIHLSERI